MNNLHSFTWDSWFSSGINHQRLLCKANVYRDSGRIRTNSQRKGDSGVVKSCDSDQINFLSRCKSLICTEGNINLYLPCFWCCFHQHLQHSALRDWMLGNRDCCLIQLSSSHTVLFANAILGIKRKKQFYEQRQHDSTRSNCEMFSTKTLKIKSSVVCFLATKCSHFS